MGSNHGLSCRTLNQTWGSVQPFLRTLNWTSGSVLGGSGSNRSSEPNLSITSTNGAQTDLGDPFEEQSKFREQLQWEIWHQRNEGKTKGTGAGIDQWKCSNLCKGMYKVCPWVKFTSPIHFCAPSWPSLHPAVQFHHIILISSRIHQLVISYQIPCNAVTHLEGFFRTYCWHLDNINDGESITSWSSAWYDTENTPHQNHTIPPTLQWSLWLSFTLTYCTFRLL